MNTIHPPIDGEILRAQDHFRSRLYFPCCPKLNQWLQDRTPYDLERLAAGLEPAWLKTGVGDRHRKQHDYHHAAWNAVFSKVTDRIGKGSIVTLVGSRGTGKTQLAADVIRFVIEQWALPDHLANIEHIAVYETEFAMMDEVTQRFGGTSLRQESRGLGYFIKPRLLVLDEVKGYRTPYAQNFLEELVDARYRDRKDTILISNLALENLSASLAESVMDRIYECGGAIEMNWSSFRKLHGCTS